MNAKLRKNRSVLKILVITLFVSMTITTTPSSAQTPNSPEDLIRDDMILIADRYATKVWTANEWYRAQWLFTYT